MVKKPQQLKKDEQEKREDQEDQILRRMLETPPKPHKPKKGRLKDEN